MTPETHAPNWHLIALSPELGDISLPISVSTSVGRQDSNDVVLTTPQISRQHAKFNQVGKNLFIQDLGSSNGTFVNGERIGTQAVEIQPDDEIAFADLVFTVAQDDTMQKLMLDNKFTPKDETQSPVVIEDRNHHTTDEPLTETSKETVYKISETSEAITPQPVSENTETSTPTQTVITDKKIPTASPILNNNDKPITSTASAMPETVSKKSPMLWIIAVIILLVIAGIILKGS